MKELSIKIGLVFAMGIVLGVGMRTAEWLIPKPESRILICMYGEPLEGPACKKLSELVDK